MIHSGSGKRKHLLLFRVKELCSYIPDKNFNIFLLMKLIFKNCVTLACFVEVNMINK